MNGSPPPYVAAEFSLESACDGAIRLGLLYKCDAWVYGYGKTNLHYGFRFGPLDQREIEREDAKLYCIYRDGQKLNQKEKCKR